MHLLLSTAYFPPVEYFAYLIKASSVSIEQHETFVKQSYRNRCSILTANGVHHLSIPLHQRKNNSVTKEIKISDSTNWQANHWKTIESAYNSSPFFQYYSDDIKDLIFSKNETLLDLNNSILKPINSLLGIKIQIDLTSEYQKTPAIIDLRNKISPKVSSTSSFPEYIQVFSSKHRFAPNLSIIDALFNLGPDTKEYLKSCRVQ